MKPIEVRLVGRFRFRSRLEGEHESLLYNATHSQTNQVLMLKGEEVKAKPKKGSLNLLQEGKVYQTMQGGIGIPYMHWCGQEEDYNFLALQGLQASLSKLLTKCQGKFTLKTALQLGVELVSILQYFHFKYFVYNNLHPRHILMGSGDKYGKFFLVDFSRANRYREPHTFEHIAESNERVTEIRNYNMQFSSLSFHRGAITSRKDDLESLIYLIWYLIEGKLPWSGEVRNMKKTQFQKSRCIIDMKERVETSLDGYPQLQDLYRYTTGLKFEEKPQYSYYSSTFSRMLEKRGIIQDHIYDWMLLDEEGPEELGYCFDIYLNQSEFLQKINGNHRKSAQEQLTEATHPQKITGKKGKHDKECVIY